MATSDSESSNLPDTETRGVSLDELKAMSHEYPALNQVLDSVARATKPSPVVLFTGAGASKPLGMPTMLEFKNSFAECLSSMRKELWNEIVESSAQYFKTTSVQVDIEGVLTYIDECVTSDRKASFLWAQINGGNLTGRPSIEQVDDLQQELRSIKNDVLDEICTTYVSPEPGKAIECYAPLFKMLHGLSGQEMTNVFTTNYDLTFEVLAESRPDDFELVDGFVTNHAGEEVFANTYVPRCRSKYSIVLWKLHGSTSWVGQLPEMRFSKVRPGKYIQGDSTTIIIYPTKNKSKSQNLHTSPFTQAYGGLSSRFSQIEGVQVLLVIGYGFGDAEVVVEMKESLAIQQRATMVVVNPTSTLEEMTKVFPSVDANRFRIIPRRFCEEGTIERIEAEIQTLLPAP